MDRQKRQHARCPRVLQAFLYIKQGQRKKRGTVKKTDISYGQRGRRGGSGASSGTVAEKCPVDWLRQQSENTRRLLEFHGARLK